MLDTQVNGIAALIGTFLFLTTATLLLRFFARFKIKASIAIDDYLVVAAWLGFIGLTALALYGVTHKFIGYREPHDTTLVNKGHPMLERVYICINVLCAWTFGTAKLSALFFLRRVFCPTGYSSLFQVISLLYILVTTAWTITFIILPVNLCPGHNVTWGTKVGNAAGCTITYPYFESSTISDFILDVLILILPLPKVWSLNISTSRKVAVSTVFLFALAGIAASLTRMIIVLLLVVDGRAINDEDVYESNAQTAFYAVLEGGFTIVTVNMPSLWYYVSGIKPERVLRSIRSFTSISSRMSRGRDTENSKGSVEDGNVSDQIHIVSSLDSKRPHSDLNGPHHQSYAMEPLPIVPDIYATRGQNRLRGFEEMV